MNIRAVLENKMKLTFSIPEAMIALGMSRQTIYNLINDAELKTYTVGRRRYISLDALLAFIEKKEAEAA